MTQAIDDNIPVLDQLIEKGIQQPTELPESLNLEIRAIIQKHTDDAVQEILSLINTKHT